MPSPCSESLDCPERDVALEMPPPDTNIQCRALPPLPLQLRRSARLYVEATSPIIIVADLDRWNNHGDAVIMACRILLGPFQSCLLLHQTFWFSGAFRRLVSKWIIRATVIAYWCRLPVQSFVPILSCFGLEELPEGVKGKLPATARNRQNLSP